MGIQLPVKSKLNYNKLFQYLSPDYWDWQLPFLLKFEFPLDIMETCTLESDLINHPSATKFPTHIEKYLIEEKEHGAILGPYETPPCELHTSPFLSREKMNYREE